MIFERFRCQSRLAELWSSGSRVSFDGDGGLALIGILSFSGLFA